MEESTLGSNEQSETCARSLLVRSKPSPARIWSRKWRRDSWTQHLSGRILRPSLGESFVDSWISSLAASHANRSALPERERETKTQDISSPISCEASQSAVPASFSSKTLKGLSVPSSPTTHTHTATSQERPFCSMSSENWSAWVTAQRREYSVRLKSGRVIRENGFLSSRWPTPCTMDTLPPKDQAALDQARIKGGCGNLREWVHHNGTFTYGQNLPDQTSGGGNQVESSMWATPRTAGSAGSNDVDWSPGQKPTKDGKPITTSLTDQVRIADQWMTPRSCEWKGNGPNSKQQGLCNQVKEPAQWGTPRQSMAQDKDKDSGKVRLGEQVHERHREQGKLSPRWVEALMGLPIGWTMPSCRNPWTVELTNSDSSETGWTQMLRKMRLECCMDGSVASTPSDPVDNPTPIRLR